MCWRHGAPPRAAQPHLAPRPDETRQAYRTACQVIDRISADVQNPALRASLEHAPLILNVYDLRASG